MKYYTHIFISCIIIFSIIVAHIKYKEKILEEQKEQAIIDYYQDTEVLLDYLCIYENDSIFNTNIGNRYLESKHKFDSLIINNK